MKQDILKQWLAALRSGEYKQGQRSLRNTNDEFCCLGVLCQLLVDQGKLSMRTFEPAILDPQYVDINNETEGSSAYIPVAAFDILGHHINDVDVEDPIIPGRRVTVSSMNDDGLTFDQIADALEKELTV